jgi:hypothetical protein
MNDSLAYRLGEIIGVIVVILTIIGFGILFVIALIKSFKTRRKGWIITASICGLPFLFIFAAFLVGMVSGVTRGFTHARQTAADRSGRPSNLLDATMTSVTGNALAYEVSLPSLDAWNKNEAKAPFDHLFSYRDAYLGIIAENIGLGTSERLSDFSRGNLEKNSTRCTTTPSTRLEINGRSWLTYDAAVTIEGIDLQYRYYVYADAKCSIQLITWTGPALFERYAPVFDRIARSFKLPPQEGGI